jgi:AcrR family transcriptional regulator
VPRDTFINLPDAKRKAITEAAIDEFAAYPFEQASVNRIVANSGIAKGSFYQYFVDKEDLFLYVMGLIAQEKINYLSPVIRNPDEHDFFTVIREMFLSGVQFARAHPRYAAVGRNVLGNKQAPIYRELQAAARPTSFALFEPLIEKAVDRGEVRADIDVGMLNYMIAAMNVSIVEYCSEIDPQSIYETATESVDAFIDLLKNGIRNPDRLVEEQPPARLSAES